MNQDIIHVIDTKSQRHDSFTSVSEIYKLTESIDYAIDKNEITNCFSELLITDTLGITDAPGIDSPKNIVLSEYLKLKEIDITPQTILFSNKKNLDEIKEIDITPQTILFSNKKKFDINDIIPFYEKGITYNIKILKKKDKIKVKLPIGLGLYLKEKNSEFFKNQKKITEEIRKKLNDLKNLFKKKIIYRNNLLKEIEEIFRVYGHDKKLSYKEFINYIKLNKLNNNLSLPEISTETIFTIEEFIPYYNIIKKKSIGLDINFKLNKINEIRDKKNLIKNQILMINREIDKIKYFFNSFKERMNKIIKEKDKIQIRYNILLNIDKDNFDYANSNKTTKEIINNQTLLVNKINLIPEIKNKDLLDKEINIIKEKIKNLKNKSEIEKELLFLSESDIKSEKEYIQKQLKKIEDSYQNLITNRCIYSEKEKDLKKKLDLLKKKIKDLENKEKEIFDNKTKNKEKNKTYKKSKTDIKKEIELVNNDYNLNKYKNNNEFQKLLNIYVNLKKSLKNMIQENKNTIESFNKMNKNRFKNDDCVVSIIIDDFNYNLIIDHDNDLHL